MPAHASPRSGASRCAALVAFSALAVACGTRPLPPRSGASPTSAGSVASAASASPSLSASSTGAPEADGDPLRQTGEASTSTAPATMATALEARPAKTLFVTELVDRAEPLQLAPTPEGGVQVLGETAWGYSFKDDLFFARLKPSGEPETLLLGTGRHARDVVVTKDAVFFSTELSGSVKLAGAVIPTVSGASDLFIGKTDPRGKLLWGKMIGTPSFDRGGYLGPTTDGGVVVAHGAFASHKNGPIVFEPAGGQDTLVSRFDADGTKRWTRALGVRGYDEPSAVLVAPSGDIFVAGTRWERKDDWAFSLVDNVCEAFVMRLSPEGEVRWNVGLGGYRGHTTASSLRLTGDGTLVLRGVLARPAKVGAFALEPLGGKGESALLATLSQEGVITSARSEPSTDCSVLHPSGATLHATLEGVVHEDGKGTKTLIASFQPQASRIFSCVLAGSGKLYVSGLLRPDGALGGVKMTAAPQMRTKVPMPTYYLGFVAGLDL